MVIICYSPKVYIFSMFFLKHFSKFAFMKHLNLSLNSHEHLAFGADNSFIGVKAIK